MKEKDEQGQILSVPDEVLMGKIHLIRGQKVMLDSDLAGLYGVETRRLKEQVRRNMERFPDDFMFKLTEDEYRQLKAGSAIAGRGGHSKYLPFAFTEHGVLMLSSVLSSKRAIQVNIRVMRIYVKIREMMMLHRDVLQRIEGIEERLTDQDNQFMVIFEYLKQFEQAKQQELEQRNRARIGFRKLDE